MLVRLAGLVLFRFQMSSNVSLKKNVFPAFKYVWGSLGKFIQLLQLYLSHPHSSPHISPSLPSYPVALSAYVGYHSSEASPC